MRYQPWVCLGGVEVVNGPRTLSYLQHAGVPGVTVDLTTCACTTLYNGGITSPASGAPWYDSNRPESGEFLGVFAVPSLPTPLQRSVTNLVAGGGMVGPMRPRPRTIAIEGSMYATSVRGMAYGERWLQDVLQGQLCAEDCAADQVEVSLECADTGFRQLLGVGIADGPVFGDSIGRSCKLQEVSFQLVAGNPYLFSRPTSVIDTSLTIADSESVVITTSEWERKVVRITVESTDGGGGPITIIATPIAPGDDCNDASSLNPCAEFIITAEYGSSIVIDSRDHSAYLYRHQTEEVESALGHLQFTGTFPWLELDPCTSICLAITSGPAATVSVDTFTKEV